MVNDMIGLEGTGSESIELTNMSKCFIAWVFSTSAVRSSSSPRENTIESACDNDYFKVVVCRKNRVDQIGPLAGQAESPRERVKLNGLIGATRSSSFG